MNKLFLMLIISAFVFSFSPVYGADITFSKGIPTWYSYDCTDATPSTWTQSNPQANVFKYLSYYFAGECHAVLLTYDASGLENIENVTAVEVGFDTKSMLLSDTSLSNQYVVPCDLFVFGNPTITNGVISQTPDNYASFSCSGNGTSAIQNIIIPYSASEYASLESQLQGGNMTYSIMAFPTFNATMRANLDSNSYQYAIGNFYNKIHITGDNFYCMFIQSSGMCNLYYEPWEAVKDALGEDYIGEWFYVAIFLPIPMAVMLSTRNGAYAGFTSLGIMLVINTIDTVVFEMSLSMILIASGFGFYEVLRKRLTDG